MVFFFLPFFFQFFKFMGFVYFGYNVILSSGSLLVCIVQCFIDKNVKFLPV